MLGQAGEESQAGAYRGRCLETLRDMRAAGMHLDPPMAQLLQQLESSS
ncbi:hypothetical protein LCGC14_1476440 [marine sediment metagenome]|uniref:Uncharacterized protein n=1 Tax=marine sediment metagenome TaxID=412755 RepID=A0A0F9MCJ2_9ZZZZ